MEELDKKLEGTHFSIDDNQDKKAYNFNKNDRKTDKETVMRWFLNRCASKDVVRAFCQIDSNEKGQFREGLTTYGVETKSQELLTIYIYSAYNEALKDEMNMLNNAVKNAQERIRRKQDITKKIIIGGAIVTVGTIASIAGFKYVLDKFGSPKTDTSISMTTEEKVEETTTEVQTEQVAESIPVEQMSAEQIQQSIDAYNEQKSQEQVEYVEQLRQDYQSETVENVQQTTPIETNVQQTTPIETNIQQTTPIEQMSADELRQSIDDYNNQVSQQQVDYVNQLRQDYQNQMTNENNIRTR